MKARPKIRKKHKFRNFVHLAMRFRKKMVIDRIDVYSAQACFNILMSIVPMLMLMLTLLKYTPLTKEMIMDTLSQILLPDIMEPVQKVVDKVYSGSITLLSFSAVSMVWVAGKGIMGLSNGLNNIYHIRENRNWLLLRTRSSLYMILFVAALIISFGFLVMGVRFQKYAEAFFPFLEADSRRTMVIFSIVGLLMLTLIFNLLYVFLPNQKRKFRSQLYGSVFTTISWIVFAFFFQLYLRLSKGLDVIYGGLLTIVVAMMWLYFLVYLFFFGAEINAWKENPDILPF